MCANTCDNNVGKHVCKHVCNGPKGPNYKLPIMVTYARTDGHTYIQTDFSGLQSCFVTINTLVDKDNQMKKLLDN